MYSFCARTDCADGATPQGGLLADGRVDFYGTTADGGGNACGDCGTIFKLASDGTETVLYAFKGGTDGMGPGQSLVSRNGYLFGTTGVGGVTGCYGDGCGTVFELKK